MELEYPFPNPTSVSAPDHYNNLAMKKNPAGAHAEISTSDKQLIPGITLILLNTL